MGMFTALEIFLTSKLNALLSTYITVFSNKVIILLQLGTPILVLYYGYSIMTPRGSNASIDEMLFNLVRIAIVFAFVQNSVGLLDLTVGFIHELKGGFIGATSVWNLLDQEVEVTQKLSEKIFDLDDSTFKIAGSIASIMIWIGSIFVLVSSSLVFIVAEVGLALLIVTSPIFIGCLTYGFTRELFNGWLRSIFSCIITLIFATLVVRIGIDVMAKMTEISSSNTANFSIFTIGSLNVVIGVIVSALVLVATKMAGNIAGVAATSAIQGGMVLAIKAGSNFARASSASRAQQGGNSMPRSSQNKQLVGSSGANSQRAQNDNMLKIASQKTSFARAQHMNSQG